MNEEEFNTHVEALIADKEEEIKNMATQFSTYHWEIANREFNFNRGKVSTLASYSLFY
jgi:hypothetical protein